MARTTDQPSTATRRNTATAQPDTNLSDSFDEQDRQGGDGQLGSNAERRESLTAVRDKRDNEGNDSSENRDEGGNLNRRDDRGFGENRDERSQHEGYAEQGSRLGQRPAPSAGLDAFTPVLEAWQQVFKSWSELAESMVKVQQDAFAGMIGAANTTAKDVNVGDRRNGELAFSGSRTTASSVGRSAAAAGRPGPDEALGGGHPLDGDDPQSRRTAAAGRDECKDRMRLATVDHCAPSRAVNLGQHGCTWAARARSTIIPMGANQRLMTAATRPRCFTVSCGHWSRSWWPR